MSQQLTNTLLQLLLCFKWNTLYYHSLFRSSISDKEWLKWNEIYLRRASRDNGLACNWSKFPSDLRRRQNVDRLDLLAWNLLNFAYLPCPSSITVPLFQGAWTRRNWTVVTIMALLRSDWILKYSGKMKQVKMKYYNKTLSHSEFRRSKME